MTEQFQKNLIKFIFQDVRAKKYIKLLDSSLFDLATHQTLFELLESYIKKHKSVPSKTNFIEFFDRSIKQGKREAIDDKVYQMILNDIAQAFSPWEGDTQFVEDVIIEEAQKKAARQLITEYADKIKNADDQTFIKLNAEMRKIVKLKEDGLNMKKQTGRFVIKDNGKHIDQVPKGTPIFLNAINKMTSAGGFHKPQLITLMGGPKCFKTGVLLNIAVGLAKSGKKVIYFDSENGEISIHTRLKQCILACTRDEVNSLGKDMRAITALIEKLGGEIRIEWMPKGSTMDDVRAKLDELADEGFIPEVAVWDYLDLYQSTDKSVRDKRIHIQDAYHGAIAVQNDYNMWGITVSIVKASAINKLVVDVQDFGEDSQKAYNCHAAFAICRTKSEMEEGTARIIPVVQRDGESFKNDIKTTCCIHIDEKTMQIEELDTKTYMEDMQARLEDDTVKAVSAQIYRRKLNIVDE